MTGPPTHRSPSLERTLRLFSDGERLMGALRSPTAFLAELPGVTPNDGDRGSRTGLRVTTADGTVVLLPSAGDILSWQVGLPGDEAPVAHIEVRPTSGPGGCTVELIATPADGHFDRHGAKLAMATLYQLILNVEAATIDRAAAQPADGEQVTSTDDHAAPATSDPAVSPGTPTEPDAPPPTHARRDLLIVVALATAVAIAIGWFLRTRSDAARRSS